jgi:hypothetical protein
MSDDARLHVTCPAPYFRAFPSTGQVPGPRCGHTLIAIGAEGGSFSSKLILFGAIMVKAVGSIKSR